MSLSINKLQRILFSLLFCLCGTLLYGQNDSIRLQQLDEVTVTEQYRTKNLRSTTPIQVLDVKLLKQAGALQVSDAVKLMNGVVVKDYGGIGGLKTISVRGLGSAHTAVAYDGLAITDVQSGQVDLGKLSLDNVDQIALYNGQSDNLLQPAKLLASAGVLNITTKAPTFTDRPIHIKSEIKGGSLGFFSPTVQVENRLNAHLVSSFTTNYQQAEGAYPYLLKNGEATEERTRENSDVKAIKSELNLYGDWAEHGKLRAKGMFYWSERGLPTNILYNTTAQERLLDRNFLAQASYEKNWDYRWQLQTNAKAYSSTTEYRDPSLAYLGGKELDIYNQQEYYLSATALYRPFANLSVALANDVFVNQMQSNGSNFATPTRETVLNALAIKYVTEQLTSSAHLLSTTTFEQVVQGTAAPNRHHLSPSVSLSLQPIDAEQFRVRAMVKDIFRLPTFSELYYGTVGRRDLKPEKALEFNIGASWQHQFSGVLSQLSLSTDLFYNRVTDKIVAIPQNMFVWSMMNIGRVDIKGAELSVETQWSITKDYNISITGGYTYQRAQDKTDPEERLYNHQIPYTPKHSGSVRSILATPYLDVAYTYLFSGHRFANQYNSSDAYIEGFGEHSLTLSHTWNLKKVDITLQLEALNFTNTQYEIVQYYPMPGRQFRTGITISY